MIRSWKILLLLAGIVSIIYFNALPNGFISDDQGITINAASWNLHTVLAQPYAFLRPLLYLGIYRVAGFTPWAFRIPNILFHLLNAWLVYALVGLLVHQRVALIASILFAIHPMAVETVAWISGGVYVQYSLFILLTLFCYTLARKYNKKKFYNLSLLFGYFAFVSSDKAIVLPLVLALYEISFGNVRRFWKRLLPFFLMALGFFILYGSLISTRITNLQTTFYQSAPVVRNPLLYIPSALTQYLMLFFWPMQLSLYHPDRQISLSLLIANSVIAFLYICIMVIAFFRSRILFFFLALFLVSILPTLLPVQVTWTVAERYAYLGSIGIIAAFTIVFLDFTRHSLARLQESVLKKSLRFLGNIGFPVILVMLLSARTIIRNADWHDEISFWTATAKTAPNLPNVHSNLAVALGQNGAYEEAIKEFQITIALKPDWVDPYYNLGLTYQRAGQTSSAVTSYKKALSLNPSLWQPYRNLAEIAFSGKRYDDAIGFLQYAIEKNPSNANLFVNLALVYQEKHDLPKAHQAINQALALDPKSAKALNILRQLTPLK